jgi:dTDP-4-amino-4,6-dideoxygalactose transaminase
MINLFNINNYKLDTSKYSSLLNDPVVEQFEQEIASFVGARYACSVHSATMAIFLCLLDKGSLTVEIPTVIPPVVPNAILCAAHKLSYRDDTNWVGSSYTLHQFQDYKIIDSAQQLEQDQFSRQADEQDLMIFSFYPTKPVGSVDGGMIVSNDKDKIDRLKILSRYGMTMNKESWKRRIILPGWKMYMNSIQADIALSNFRKLENKNKSIAHVKSVYNDCFGLENVSNHLYRLRLKNRDSFMCWMKEDGVQCGIHYDTVHNVECYGSESKLSLGKSVLEAAQTVSIPLHEKLTHKDIMYIVKKVKQHAIFA